MNAPLPLSLRPLNMQTMTPDFDIVATVKGGGMPLSLMVQHAEQLQQDGHPQAASNLYALWLAHNQDPRQHLVWFNHGSLLQQLGHLVQAQKAYEQALALSPDFAQAHINLGLVLEKQGLSEQAIAAWARLTGHRYAKDPVAPDMLTTALNHIGRVHENNRDYRHALEALEHSLLINPKQTGVIQHWVHIRQKACEWPVYKPLPGISKNEMVMATSPLAMLALTDDPLLQLLSAHAFVARTYGLKEEYLCKVKAYHHPKKRIGFASADLREHAVGFLLPTMLESLDREKYELFAYDFTVDDGSAHRQKLLGMFDHVRPIHILTDRQAAERILEDEIDVMIDLHGLSAGARPGIFALHPAPKQGTYLGFIGTTGMPWFDFVITDRHALPPEHTEYFMEKPLYVDGSFIPLTPPDEDLPVVTRADVGLPEDAFVMGAFGNVYKITPEMFDVWMRLLKEIPDAVLWLIDDNATTTENLKNHARLANADLSRIIFSSRTLHKEFCSRLKLCDVYLDTYPYNCGSTTNDVIRAGVPLVTKFGRSMVSRMGKSIQEYMGFNHLSIETEFEYIDCVKKVHADDTHSNEIKKICDGIHKNYPNKNILKSFETIFDESKNSSNLKDNQISKKNTISQFANQIKLDKLATESNYLKNIKNSGSPIISLITHHYNAHDALDNLIKKIESMDEKIKSNIELIVIDDFSDQEKKIKSTLQNFQHYRVTDDINWNQGGARNLGALMSKSSWLLFFDIDQVPTETGLCDLIENIDKLKSNTLYYFHVENFVDSNLNVEMKIHPNTFIANNSRFKEIGMYDEDFSGNYGFEDLYMSYLWKELGGEKEIYGNSPFFKDIKYKTTGLNRDLSINRKLSESKILKGNTRPKNFLRFNWKNLND